MAPSVAALSVSQELLRCPGFPPPLLWLRVGFIYILSHQLCRTSRLFPLQIRGCSSPFGHPSGSLGEWQQFCGTATFPSRQAGMLGIFTFIPPGGKRERSRQRRHSSESSGILKAGSQFFITIYWCYCGSTALKPVKCEKGCVFSEPRFLCSLCVLIKKQLS